MAWREKLSDSNQWSQMYDDCRIVVWPGIKYLRHQGRCNNHTGEQGRSALCGPFFYRDEERLSHFSVSVRNKVSWCMSQIDTHVLLSPGFRGCRKTPQHQLSCIVSHLFRHVNNKQPSWVWDIDCVKKWRRTAKVCYIFSWPSPGLFFSVTSPLSIVSSILYFKTLHIFSCPNFKHVFFLIHPLIKPVSFFHDPPPSIPPTFIIINDQSISRLWRGSWNCPFP